MDATIQQDYFSTVLPDGFELVAAPPAIRDQPHIPPARSLRRDAVRPILLTTPPPRTLPDLYPREGLFARLLGTVLAFLLIMATVGVTAHFSSKTPSVAFSSPSLTAAATQLDRRISPLIAMSLRQLNQNSFVLNHRWIDVPAEISIYSVVEMSVLTGCLMVMFAMGRRIAGSFGGLLALLMASVALLGATVMAHGQLAPHSILANGFAMCGLLLLATSGRRHGVANTVVCGVAASLSIGTAAVFDRAEILLIVPLLMICINLPWRWSWLMPLTAAAPIAGMFVCDAHFFGVRFSERMPLDIFYGGSDFIEASVNWLQHFPSAAVFLPMAVIGFGLLIKSNARWGLLLLSWCMPAIGLLAAHGIEADQRVIIFALPAAILATTWLISRSPIAGGLVVALVSLMWLHAPASTPLSPADVSGNLPAQQKSMSIQNAPVQQFIIM